MISNRANAICILEILKEFSDENHILTTREIISKMKNIYGLSLDRRTVYSTLELLIELGYDISCYHENGKGYYLLERMFEPSEVRLLMDSVYSNQAISLNLTTKLIKKLQKVMSVHDRKSYRWLTVIKNKKKTLNKEVFLNIDILEEAIRKKKKVGFIYLTYDFDKSLIPRRKEKYIVDPYRMVSLNEHYYLICKMNNNDSISFYRIDLMKEVNCFEDSKIDSMPNEDELQEIENKTIYAWYGKATTVLMRCKNDVLRDVIDKFGQDISIERENEETFLATVKVAPNGIRFWALQYLSHVEVVTPQWLRESIIESIEQNLYCKVL